LTGALLVPVPVGTASTVWVGATVPGATVALPAPAVGGVAVRVSACSPVSAVAGRGLLGRYVAVTPAVGVPAVVVVWRLLKVQPAVAPSSARATARGATRRVQADPGDEVYDRWVMA